MITAQVISLKLSNYNTTSNLSKKKTKLEKLKESEVTKEALNKLE